VSADKIVNQGSRAWNIIAGTQPNANLAHEICNAVPDVPDLTPMTTGLLQAPVNWKIERDIAPIPLVYPLALPAVRIEILLHYKYGSRYNNGGAYIESCWFEAPNCFLEWGFEVWLNADVAVDNHGTTRAPIGYLAITVDGRMTAKDHWEKPLNRTFQIRGDGFIPKL
jgi:hypothetical protein